MGVNTAQEWSSCEIHLQKIFEGMNWEIKKMEKKSNNLPCQISDIQLWNECKQTQQSPHCFLVLAQQIGCMEKPESQNLCRVNDQGRGNMRRTKFHDCINLALLSRYNYFIINILVFKRTDKETYAPQFYFICFLWTIMGVKSCLKNNKSTWFINKQRSFWFPFGGQCHP